MYNMISKTMYSSLDHSTHREFVQPNKNFITKIDILERVYHLSQLHWFYQQFDSCIIASSLVDKKKIMGLWICKLYSYFSSTSKYLLLLLFYQVLVKCHFLQEVFSDLLILVGTPPLHSHGTLHLHCNSTQHSACLLTYHPVCMLLKDGPCLSFTITSHCFDYKRRSVMICQMNKLSCLGGLSQHFIFLLQCFCSL